MRERETDRHRWRERQILCVYIEERERETVKYIDKDRVCVRGIKSEREKKKDERGRV
jgi:hypothetical protein